MEFKVGDRVRVTFEGVVSSAQFDDEIQIRTERDGHHWAPVSAVEKITPPLPTTPGSVIRARHRLCSETHFWLTPDGWECVEPEHRGFGTQANLFEDVEVIFDAGAK